MLLASLLMVQPVIAATSLCVEEASTGFDWQASRWEQANFFPRQYVVREWARTDDAALSCFIQLDDKGLSDTVTQGTYLDTSAGCYSIVGVGEEPGYSDFTVCAERFLKTGEVLDIDCRDARYLGFEFAPTGQFVAWRIYSVLDGAADANQRDSVAVSVGKCSVVAP